MRACALRLHVQSSRRPEVDDDLDAVIAEKHAAAKALGLPTRFARVPADYYDQELESARES